MGSNRGEFSRCDKPRAISPSRLPTANRPVVVGEIREVGVNPRKQRAISFDASTRQEIRIATSAHACAIVFDEWVSGRNDTTSPIDLVYVQIDRSRHVNAIPIARFGIIHRPRKRRALY